MTYYVTILSFENIVYIHRHKKRRVVTEQFVDNVVNNCYYAPNITPKVRWFVQSDVKDVIDDLIDVIGSHPRVHPVHGYDQSTPELNPNPYNVMTEREVATLVRLVSILVPSVSNILKINTPITPHSHA
jgi:hypothetical protein